MPRTPFYFPNIQAVNPGRSPAWRWERAKQVVESGQNVSSKRDDELTCDAIRYLRTQYQSPNAIKRIQPHARAVIGGANVIQSNPLSRAEIQARILSRQSFRMISELMEIPWPIVPWYAALFFDVRERLDCSYYIWEHVIRAAPDLALHKILESAYQYGSGVIDGWLDFLRHARENHDLAEARGRSRELFHLYQLAQVVNLSSVDSRFAHAALDRGVDQTLGDMTPGSAFFLMGRSSVLALLAKPSN